MNWAASMQLHVWLGAAHDETRQGVERHLGKTMQRQFVHLVEREVHYSREPAFDHQAAAGEPAHHVADPGTKINVSKKSGAEPPRRPTRRACPEDNAP